MFSLESSQLSQSGLGLLWLIRLRWLALAGQLLICAFVCWGLHYALPWTILSSCFAFIAMTNGLLVYARNAVEDRADFFKPLIIVSDVLVLTIMLYYTGGAHNPFTMLYLLNITLATILLPSIWAWSVVVFCGICFGMLFQSDHMLIREGGMTCCDDMETHLQGMLVGMLITGGGIAYFVNRLSKALQAHRESLARARESGERAQRFASLATLAAGVAHELATPLATIAVISRDLERLAGKAGGQQDYLADARLIRQEVERCRSILDQLSQEAVDRELNEPESVTLRDIPLLLKEYLPATLKGRLSWEANPRDAVVRLPLKALLRSLSILVKNACEASSEEQPVHLEIQLADGELCLQVKDAGEGMPAEVVARLGEPFFSTKPGGGMGLGVFLVRTFVERLEGRFEVESAPRKGTTVALRIPEKGCLIHA